MRKGASHKPNLIISLQRRGKASRADRYNTPIEAGIQPLSDFGFKLGTEGMALTYKPLHFLFLAGFVALAALNALAQEPAPKGGGASAPDANGDVMRQVITGAKEAERALYLYERIEKVESRKDAGDAAPQSVRVSRVVPAGTGIARITLGPDGKPPNAEAYRDDLNKLLNSLTWAAATGQPQREAYQKVQRKQKDRDELIDATNNAFIFRFVDQEQRGDRMLAKYRMEPNPKFKSTNRATSIFAKVKGFVWIDESAHELARVEGEVTDDISFGGFLAKVYKGSRFMQDRYEMAPGLWMPSFTQYDFDGRKFFSSFSVHEKTFYSAYKRIGPPAEAIPRIQSEIAQLDAAKSAENR